MKAAIFLAVTALLMLGVPAHAQIVASGVVAEGFRAPRRTLSRLVVCTDRTTAR